MIELRFNRSDVDYWYLILFAPDAEHQKESGLFIMNVIIKTLG